MDNENSFHIHKRILFIYKTSLLVEIQIAATTLEINTEKSQKKIIILKINPPHDPDIPYLGLFHKNSTPLILLSNTHNSPIQNI